MIDIAELEVLPQEAPELQEADGLHMLGVAQADSQCGSGSGGWLGNANEMLIAGE